MKDFPFLGAMAIGIGTAILTTQTLDATLGDTTREVIDVTDDDPIPVMAASSGVIMGAGLYFGVRGLCWAIRKVRGI